MPQRKALRVLPEPVGAQMSVLAPEAIFGQPAAWAGVGTSNEASNQRLVGSLKSARGVDFALESVAMLNRSSLCTPPATDGGAHEGGGMHSSIVGR